MPVTVVFRLAMKARDGVELFSDVYLPERTGRFPLIVLRSPYQAEQNTFSDFAAEFCRDGIGVVIQDCRGTGRSGGEIDIARQEEEDGLDFLNWVASQDFCNGRLVSNGESYPGHVQWQMARHNHPALKGLTPHNAPLNFYSVAFRPGGAWGNGLASCWAFGVRMRRTHEESSVKIDWSKILLTRPMKNWDTAAGIREWPLWKTWAEHVCFDEFWKKADVFPDIPEVTAPAFITGGWFDLFLPQTLKSFSEMRKHAGSEAARRFTRCVIEPLDHNGDTGDVDYGPDHLADIIATRNCFMKNILAQPDGTDPLPDQPPLRFFVMGSNRWMDADEWPLPGTEYTPFYLRASAPANSLAGAGKISREPPAPNTPECMEIFTANPLSPVPTAGGNNLSFTAGQRNQKTVEKRSDVLVFTGEPMTEDLDVIGNVRAILYASADTPDADFTAKLCDVSPDGVSYNVCDGILRGRFRDGCEKESLLTPGKIYRFEIDLWATAWTFLRGHRIRVQIAGSNFPRFDCNPNTGKHLTADPEARAARLTLLHTAECPSHLLLPVLPAGKGGR